MSDVLEMLRDVYGDRYINSINTAIKKMGEIEQSKIQVLNKRTLGDILINEKMESVKEDVIEYLSNLKIFLAGQKIKKENVKLLSNKIVQVIEDELNKVDKNLLDYVSPNIFKTLIVNRVNKRNTRAGRLYNFIPLLADPLLDILIDNKKSEDLNNSEDYVETVFYSFYVSKSLENLFKQLSAGKSYQEFLLNELIKPEENNLFFKIPKDFLKDNISNILSFSVKKEEVNLYNNQIVNQLIIAFDKFFGLEGSLDEEEYNRILNKDLSKEEFTEHSRKIKEYLLHPNILDIFERNKISVRISIGNFSMDASEDAGYFKEEFRKIENNYEGKGNFRYFERYTLELLNLFAHKHKQIILNKLKTSPYYSKIKNLINDYYKNIVASYNMLEKIMIRDPLKTRSSDWLSHIFSDGDYLRRIVFAEPSEQPIDSKDAVKKYELLRDILTLSLKYTNFSKEARNVILKIVDDKSVVNCTKEENMIQYLLDYQRRCLLNGKYNI